LRISLTRIQVRIFRDYQIKNVVQRFSAKRITYDDGKWFKSKADLEGNYEKVEHEVEVENHFVSWTTWIGSRNKNFPIKPILKNFFERT
jgi:hypothetical protein